MKNTFMMQDRKRTGSVERIRKSHAGGCQNKRRAGCYGGAAEKAFCVEDHRTCTSYYMCITASACICQCGFIPADCLVFRADFFDSGIRCGCPDLCALRHRLCGDGIYLYVFVPICVPDYGGQRTYLYGDRHTVYDAYGMDVCIRPAWMLQGNCLGMEKNLRKEASMKNRHERKP